MSPTLALIPAKLRSDGVPNKNWTPINAYGDNCVDLAMQVGMCCDRIVVSSNAPKNPMIGPRFTWLPRPDNLCTPEASMLDVVKHALSQVPGPDDEIIVLLQPTSPLRTAETVKQAIQMLEKSTRAKRDVSVVSVSPSYPNAWNLRVNYDGTLGTFDEDTDMLHWMPSRRQDCMPTFKRDGVVYAFRRAVMKHWISIYGGVSLPLHTPPAESLSIDTPEDWDEAVRRLNQCR